MGRAVKSQGLAPPAIRKDTRAKQARNIVNKIIPALLASNQRARKGSESSELISNPVSDAPQIKKGPDGDDASYVKRKGQGKRRNKSSRSHDEGLMEEEIPTTKPNKGRVRKDELEDDSSTPSITKACSVRIAIADTLTAAKVLHDGKRRSANVCILNMASPLRPGGGVLLGATSQEEFLCARTTLLSSLREEYYRLPELGGIWTPDVLVFRTPSSLGDTAGELALTERYWIDVISAGMLRFPELEGEEDEVKTLSRQDLQIVENKMRAVLRIAARKKVKKLVLGAWGCGAYGNPVPDIARAWKKILDPAMNTKDSNKSQADTWPVLEEIMFAISNKKMAKDFAKAFGGVDVETISSRNSDDDDVENDDEDKVAQELRTKIEEIEGQINSVWNADLRTRLETILDQLRTQLKEREELSGSDGGVDIDQSIPSRARLPQGSTIRSLHINYILIVDRSEENVTHITVEPQIHNHVINHIAISVPDLDAAVEWYTTVFGFKKIRNNSLKDKSSNPKENIFRIYGDTLQKVRIAYLGTGNSVGLEIFQFIDPPAQPIPQQQTFEYTRPGIFHICVTTPDVENAIQLVLDKGGSQIGHTVELGRDADGEMRKAAYLKDPWGTVVEVLSCSFEALVANRE